jgi:hypothetical protein
MFQACVFSLSRAGKLKIKHIFVYAYILLYPFLKKQAFLNGQEKKTALLHPHCERIGEIKNTPCYHVLSRVRASGPVADKFFPEA